MSQTAFRPPVGTTEGRHKKRAASTLSLAPEPGSWPATPTRVWRVWAKAYLVAGRHRQRLSLIVMRCIRCGQSHSHTAGPEFREGRRTAACGARYIVMVDVAALDGAA